MLADHSWLRAGARAPGTRRTRQFQVQSNPGQQRDKVQPIPGQQPGGQSKTHPWSAAEWMGGSQPTPGGRRGPRTPAVVRSAPACCEGHYRGRCGSFFPKPRPAAPGSSERQGRGTKGTGAGRSLQRRLSQLADPGTVLPALGVPKLDLKEPSLIPDLQTLCSGDFPSDCCPSCPCSLRQERSRVRDPSVVYKDPVSKFISIQSDS